MLGDIGSFVLYFIIFSVAFAILRNIFNRVRERVQLPGFDKPTNWKNRLRRAISRNDGPNQRDEEQRDSPQLGEPKEIVELPKDENKSTKAGTAGFSSKVGTSDNYHVV